MAESDQQTEAVRGSESGNQATPSELLTKKELARRLRVSERKIELDLDLPRIRWGRTVRFDWLEVVRFLKETN